MITFSRCACPCMMRVQCLFVIGLYLVFSVGAEECGIGKKRATKFCSSYEECVEGVWTLKQCPIYHAFNQGRESCQYGYNCRPKRQSSALDLIKKIQNALPSWKPVTKNESIVPPDSSEDSLSSILPAECGYYNPDTVLGKVVNGREATIEKSPWQVAILDVITLDLQCGGSIISLWHVLTAAHCFFTQDEKPIAKSSRMILSAATNLSEPGQSFSISQLYIHSKYKLIHRKNDIALIKIAGKFEFTSKTYPVCLPHETSSYTDYLPCKISGWGQTSWEKKTYEQVIHVIETRIVPMADCKRENGNHLRVTKGMFCVGNYTHGQVDTCQGDSGGPCFCQDGGKETLFGITSWGVGCGRKHYPGVYLKVYEYDTWIKHKLEVSMGYTSSWHPSEDQDIDDQ